jgi:hypothetical protein
MDPVGFDGLAAPVGRWGKVDYPDANSLFAKDDYDSRVVFGSVATFLSFLALTAGTAWGIVRGFRRSDRKV